MDIPYLKEVRITNCDCEGKRSPANGHFFIILSKHGYNVKSNYVLGVPLTSAKKNYFVLNYGINITNDDVEGNVSPFIKQTFVYCDRICRISKEDIIIGQEEIRVTGNKWEEMLSNLIAFLKEGRIDKKY